MRLSFARSVVQLTFYTRKPRGKKRKERKDEDMTHSTKHKLLAFFLPPSSFLTKGGGEIDPGLEKEGRRPYSIQFQLVPPNSSWLSPPPLQLSKSSLLLSYPSP